MKRRFISMAGACFMLVALPWLAALSLAVANFMVDILSGAQSPALRIGVSTDYFWIATRWLSIVTGFLFAVFAALAVLFPGYHHIESDGRENTPLPYAGVRRKRRR